MRLTYLVSTAMFGLLLAGTVHAATITSDAVDHIVIQPNDRPTLVEQFTDVQFLATAVSADGQEISGVTLSWAVGGDIGIMNNKGIFTAKKGGVGQVIAKTGNVTASIGIVVRVAPKSSTTNTNVAKPPVTSPTPSTVTENVVPPDESVAPNTSTTTPVATCTTVRLWVWVVLTLGFAFFLFLYFLTLGNSRSAWWWLWPLANTAGMIELFQAVRCGTFFGSWVPWTFLGLGLLLSVFYVRVLRPKDFSHSPAQL